MKDIKSFNKFEQLIFEAYKEISSVGIEEWHDLMKEYANALIAVRDDVSNYEMIGNKFLGRLRALKKDIESNNKGKIETEPSLMEDGFDPSMTQFTKIKFDEKYVPWVLTRIGAQSDLEFRNENSRFIRNDLFRWFGDYEGFAAVGKETILTNQIIEYNIGFEDLSYALKFNDGILLHGRDGIRFPRPDFNKFEILGGYYIMQKRLLFPKGGLIKQTHFSDIGYPGSWYEPKLFSVDINLSYEF